MATGVNTIAKTGKYGDLRRRLLFLLLALVVLSIPRLNAQSSQNAGDSDTLLQLSMQ